jgi:2-(1,2-epoxy-1,2-dihydrophenyl)acetyl-CoA isomerase
VRVILLTGGGKGLLRRSAIGRRLHLQCGKQIGANMRASINPLIEKMRGSPKPIVVAVNGPAAGAGAGIAPAGDVVVAACASLFREDQEYRRKRMHHRR